MGWWRTAEACILRELKEELDVTSDMLENFSLRYVVLRRTKGEIRQESIVPYISVMQMKYIAGWLLSALKFLITHDRMILNNKTNERGYYATEDEKVDSSSHDGASAWNTCMEYGNDRQCRFW